MPIKANSVAVIGAGPAGVIATDALVKEQAFEKIRVFDRRPIIGGAWVYTPHLPAKIPSLRDLVEGNIDAPVPIPSQLPAETPKSEAVNSHQIRYSDTPQHENLHSDIIPSIMSYTQYPFPDTLSERIREKYGPGAPFRDRELVREWIEDIFVRNGNDKLIELNTTVERAEKRDGKWVLTLRKDGPGKNHWWQEKFDALVVASGHYNIPWIPQIPGLFEYDARFEGRVLHSKHFRDATKFKGKRVIVVGGSVSAAEIIHEILPYAQHPVIGSLRGDPIPAFGFVPWTHPHIVIKKQITKFDPDTGRIFFADGSHIDHVDHVIFGTGYTFSLPYLPSVQEKIKRSNRRLPGVYQHTWNIDDPSLVFVGMLGGGFTFRVYEWQAVAIARHLSGRAKDLPPVKEQKEWERKRVEALGGGKSYYSIAPNYENFFEFLRDFAGDPVLGTTGLALPPFDKKWQEEWEEMIAPKIKAWKRARQRAEEGDKGRTRAKL
ncbi:FAD/NAD(P)-binding domain-containing protein [Lepidopterella palustris CBS 459.81]|uniref:FAD/NAD(P)-binding domain-containing protein n=1 Tax=Lepidopterella palustris CBS 459.81 TaxID=1314670 RepID=A0A8E2JJ13_9PEZI|nr:FAD/NAD(P)-binding domain-containing protein [Lepidopterella palustris CBS 459.81]